MSTNYVCGFAFNEDRTEVALIRKNRPESLNGFFNGIGGTVIAGEGYVAVSMARTFLKETGCDTDPVNWVHMGKLTDVDYSIYWMYTKLPNDKFAEIKTTTDEEVFIMNVGDDIIDLPLSEWNMDDWGRLFLSNLLNVNLDLVVPYTTINIT